ncbi:RND transporter, partial [Burkholderia pseudomallei]
LATVQYEAGTAGYLQEQLAEQPYRQARLAWVPASAQRLQDTVALYAALGGGRGGARQP